MSTHSRFIISTATPAADLVIRGFDVTSIRVEPATGATDGSRVVGLERLDFPAAAELCYSCGIELLPSGCKFDPWFCNECLERAVALNRQLGGGLIPIGRHSLLHQIGLSREAAADEATVEAFQIALRGFFAATARLPEWQKRIVRRNCAAVGLLGRASSVSIRVYLRAVRRLSRQAAFESLSCWWTRGQLLTPNADRPVRRSV